MENPSLKNITAPNFGTPPANQNENLQKLGEPHVTSFNYIIEKGLDQAISGLNPVEFTLKDNRVKLVITGYTFNSSEVPFGHTGVANNNIYPSECRQRASSYEGKFFIKVDWFIDGQQQPSFEKDLGNIPIMVKSNRCHLANMNPKELVKHGEHEQEWGGYFIIKGHERLVRMLLMTRRNYPIAIRRSGWKQRGALFSDLGISIRCVTNDETSTNNVLHFVTDGSAKLMFSYKKTLYYAPLTFILKCLCDYCDRFIYVKLLRGHEDNMYYSDCIQNMLRDDHEKGLHTSDDCREYLGKMFRVKFTECPEWYTNLEIANFILKKCILIHLDRYEEKFDTLAFMTQKLFTFAQDKCKVEGADAVMMQELLLGGHLYLQVLKENLQMWLVGLKRNILKLAGKSNFVLNSAGIMKAAKYQGGIAASLSMFLATGNLQRLTGLGLMQDKGLTIVPENINRMRYMSHFRAVHRGSFFQEMRTTEARQLLPDAWGFICPVHTPDGTPCGLLNHLTMNCQVTDVPDEEKVKNIPYILTEYGMVPIKYAEKVDPQSSWVMLDGKVLGYVQKSSVVKLVEKLRELKIKGDKVPNTLEIVSVPWKKTVSQFPGLFLFTGPARMMRPVMNLLFKKVELIGTFEQVYLDICVKPEEYYKGVTTHMELSKTSFLSNLAQLIPMPDMNQSPRNMYQCQMGKQTMGTPCHNWDLQSETKLYRLQTPASPLFRPVHYDNILLDDFAMGTNAIVAVISYTGYDMEDAMIINKASEERGLAHGSIYKSEFIQLDDSASYFARDPDSPKLAEYLDLDGLPYVGRKISDSEPLYCFYDADKSQYIVKLAKGKEQCYLHSVKICATIENKRSGKIACLTYRIPRNPSVGDKFASRAGQKGICSVKWPAEDLPFTETGLVPDIVFNPHGFPSRMTIAMMVEIMAGKSAALHGLVHDATPFRFSEEDTAIDYFGKLLELGGYNYYGTETMYSGIDGREMNAHIFFGIVHYQRLRHMVSDKWQVRSTGPMNILTRQPLKGRKRGGGVRFGEMERDALLSHGASFLLQDRLLHCSDETTAFICTSCGTILGPITEMIRVADKPQHSETKETCRLCGHGNDISQIKIPYIFRFFLTQMASCNINIRIKCQEI